jgi:hypothetical protein
MRDAVVEQVHLLQVSMVESGRPCFLESELDDLRCLIRLTVEFFSYLQGEDLAPLVEDKLRYVCDSVFSGVGSFTLVSSAYWTLPGARQTTLSWDLNLKSTDSLRELFVSKYNEFFSEKDFERKCRFLLDLFKLQIVFAGLLY